MGAQLAGGSRGKGRFRRRGGTLPPVYALMVVVIFALPFVTVPEYSIREHTTSELGAQGAPHAWVMNAVFALLGVASVLDAWPVLAGLWFHRVAIVSFGLSMVMVALFQHAPVPVDEAFSAREDDLHSVFSGLGGMSFIAFAVGTAFVEAAGRDRWLGPAVGAFATLMSILIFAAPALAGVWQRALFLTTFGWLVVYLADRRRRAGRPGMRAAP